MTSARQWMAPPDSEVPFTAVYRNLFTADEESVLEFEYSADERAAFFLDGQWIGNGPERGCPQRWYLGHISAGIQPGQHTLTARLYCFGKEWTTYAQMSIRHGLYVKEKSDLLKDWKYALETGIGFEHPFPDWCAYPRVHVGKNYTSGLLRGKGGIWNKVDWFTDDRILHEPDLPPMKHREIFPDSICGSIKKFNRYVCVWCHYRFHGRGKVRIRWAETPYLTEEYDPLGLKGKKGNRDGSFFVGNFDEFEVDGELEWHDYWWRAGHYTQILTEGEISVDSRYYETGYPFPAFHPGSPLESAAYETLQACSHETFMDCPFYEQLMYIGDSRIEALCIYSITDDHRLPEKALRVLSLSQIPDGMILSRYPAKEEQIIPSFMTLYLLMVHDYWRFHGKNTFLLEILPYARKVANYLTSNLRDGLLYLPGWNFIDWTKEWKNGVPDAPGTNCILNWMAVYAFGKMAEMDDSRDWKGITETMKRAIYRTYYIPEERIFADDPEKKYFSEHAQVMALLASPESGVQEALRRKGLAECGICYSFYYLEACRMNGLDDLYAKRMAKYEKILGEGLTTFPEEFDNPRSDCHAWSSHILYFSLLERKKNQATVIKHPQTKRKEVAFSL